MEWDEARFDCECTKSEPSDKMKEIGWECDILGLEIWRDQQLSITPPTLGRSLPDLARVCPTGQNVQKQLI